MAYDIFKDSGETLEQLDRKLKGYTYMDVEERYQHVLNEVVEVDHMASKFDMAIEGLLTTAESMETMNGAMPKAALEAHYDATAYQAEQLTGNVDMVGLPPIEDYTYGDDEFKEGAIKSIKTFAKKAAKKAIEIIRKIVQRLRDELLNSRGAVYLRLAMSRRALKKLKEVAKNTTIEPKELPKASYHSALSNVVIGNTNSNPKVGVIENGTMLIKILETTAEIVDRITGGGGAMEYTVQNMYFLLKTNVGLENPDHAVTMDELKRHSHVYSKSLTIVEEINANIPGLNGHVPIIQPPRIWLNPGNGPLKNSVGQVTQVRTTSYNLPKEKRNPPSAPMGLTKAEIDKTLSIVESLIDEKNHWSKAISKHLKKLDAATKKLAGNSIMENVKIRVLTAGITRMLMAEAYAVPPIVLPTAKAAMQYVKQTIQVCATENKSISSSKELVVV